MVLHAHIAAAAVTGAAGTGGAADLARVQEVLAAVTTEQVRQWCGNPDTTVTVKPVLDLAEHIWVMSYEASERLKDQTRLRDGTCTHPWCTRAAVRCDCEHRVPHDPEHPERGPTCSCNLAPVLPAPPSGEDHRRLDLRHLEPGTYLWRSPLGYQYLRDHTGTIDVTPDADRRRYARELIAHFGDQPPDQSHPAPHPAQLPAGEVMRPARHPTPRGRRARLALALELHARRPPGRTPPVCAVQLDDHLHVPT